MSDDDLERPRAAELVTPILPVLVMLAVMWVSEIVDVVLDHRLDRYGIEPRQIDGLDGVLFAPFLHGGFGHLIANTFPFLILGGIIAGASTVRFLNVTAIVGLIGGHLGTDFLDEDAAKAGYERHLAEVRATIPADRLLEWRAPDGWAPLCDALGVPVPAEPFPLTNTTEEWLSRRG